MYWSLLFLFLFLSPLTNIVASLPIIYCHVISFSFFSLLLLPTQFNSFSIPDTNLTFFPGMYTNWSFLFHFMVPCFRHFIVILLFHSPKLPFFLIIVAFNQLGDCRKIMPPALLDPPLSKSSSVSSLISGTISQEPVPENRLFDDLRGLQWRINLGVFPSSSSSTSVDDLRRATANSRRR